MSVEKEKAAQPSLQADGSVNRLTGKESALQRHDVTARHPLTYRGGGS